MKRLQSISQKAQYSDIPDCWKKPEDIPDIEEMVAQIKGDPIFADCFFLQETNNPENEEDGTYKPLADYQGYAFQTLDDNQHVWWQGARGSSKTSGVARWLVGRCLRYAKTEAVLFAPSFRQSKNMFQYCLDWLYDNFGVDSHVYKLEFELSADPKIGHEPVIVFKNGSRIRAFPLGDGEKLRGLRANIIWIDEFYQFDKTIYNSHIAPIGNVKIGNQPTKMIYTTTSWYQDCFAFSVLRDIAMMIQKGRQGYAIIDTRLDDVLSAVRTDGTPYPYDKSYIAHQLETQSDQVTGKLSDELLMTFFNVWIKSSANFYSATALSECRDASLQVREKRLKGDKTPCVGSCDPATNGSDACTMSVVGVPGSNQRDLWATFKYEKLKPEEIAGYIHKMVDNYGMTLIVVDKSGGLGTQVADKCAATSQLIDGVWQDRQPIMIHDHPDAHLARAHIVLTKPSDERIRNGIMGPRYDSAITGEIDLKNWFHLNMKQVIESGKFRIPLLTKDADYYENERGEIMDNINEGIAQFPRIDRVRNPDGSLKTDYRGNYYFTRPAKDDAAYSIVYANYAANIWYKEHETPNRQTEKSVLWQGDDIRERAIAEQKFHKIEIARLF